MHRDPSSRARVADQQSTNTLHHKSNIHSHHENRQNSLQNCWLSSIMTTPVNAITVFERSRAGNVENYLGAKAKYVCIDIYSA